MEALSRIFNRWKKTVYPIWGSQWVKLLSFVCVPLLLPFYLSRELWLLYLSWSLIKLIRRLESAWLPPFHKRSANDTTRVRGPAVLWRSGPEHNLGESRFLSNFPEYPLYQQGSCPELNWGLRGLGRQVSFHNREQWLLVKGEPGIWSLGWGGDFLFTAFELCTICMNQLFRK